MYTSMNYYFMQGIKDSTNAITILRNIHPISDFLEIKNFLKQLALSFFYIKKDQKHK